MYQYHDYVELIDLITFLIFNIIKFVFIKFTFMLQSNKFFNFDKKSN